MIATYVIEFDEADEDGSIDDDGADLYEEDESGSVEAGVRTCVTEVGAKEVEEVQQALKASSILSYILKPNSLFTQLFKYNNKAQEKIFKYMCNFEVLEEWRNGIRAVSSYPDVEASKDQYRLLNPTLLGFITGHIMDNAVFYRALKRMPQRRLN